MERNELVLKLCWALFGTPYIYAGNCPIAGLDCSGAVCEILRSVGVIGKEDLKAQELYDKFKGFSDNKTRQGALLFFGKTTEMITHVAIAISETHMFEAGGGDSTTYSTEKAIKQNAYFRVRPISNRRDLIASRFVL